MRPHRAAARLFLALMLLFGGLAPGLAQVYPAPPGTGTLATSTADGANASIGAKNDATCPTDNGNCSLIALQKRSNGILNGATPASQAGSGLGQAALGVMQQDGLKATVSGTAAGALATVSGADAGFPSVNAGGWFSTAGFNSAIVDVTAPGTGNTFVVDFSSDGGSTVRTSSQIVAGSNTGTSTTASSLSQTAANRLPVEGTLMRLRESAAGATPAASAVVVLKVANITPIGVYATLGGGLNSMGGLGAVSGGSGLTSVSRIVSAAASTNATPAKSSGGRLYKITGKNVATSDRWLKFYNKSSTPAPGTDIPFFQVVLPPGPFSYDGADIGFYFSAGIGYAITTGAADNDNTALTAGDVLNLNVWYQ